MQHPVVRLTLARVPIHNVSDQIDNLPKSLTHSTNRSMQRRFFMQQGKPSIHVKLILCILEQLSALKTYFHQSEIFCFVKAKEDEYQYKSR
jgi:hypothetical protein